MPSIKRWLPLIGVFVLAVSTLLEAFGMPEAAKAIVSVGGLIGATAASPVPAAEIAAAAAALAGVAIKVYNVVRQIESK